MKRRAIVVRRDEAKRSGDWDTVEVCDRALAKGPRSAEWKRIAEQLAPMRDAGLVERMLRGMK